MVARLDLLGLPGAALVETLRLFRPALPVFCHEGTESVAVRSRCPVVSEGATELDRLLLAFEQGGLNGLEVPALPEPVARRAREQYDRIGDLVQAAREMAGWLVAD